MTFCIGRSAGSSLQRLCVTKSSSYNPMEVRGGGSGRRSEQEWRGAPLSEKVNEERDWWACREWGAEKRMSVSIDV